MDDAGHQDSRGRRMLGVARRQLGSGPGRQSSSTRAQCNGCKAKDSNPACSVELHRLPSPALSTDPKSQPTLPPLRILVTYFNRAEETIVAVEGATAQRIQDPIVARDLLIDTEQMFHDGGEKRPVIIPEEELGMPFPGINVWFRIPKRGQL